MQDTKKGDKMAPQIVAAGFLGCWKEDGVPRWSGSREVLESGGDTCKTWRQQREADDSGSFTSRNTGLRGREAGVGVVESRGLMTLTVHV